MKSLSKKLAMMLAVLLLLGMLPVSAMAGNPPAEADVTEPTGTQIVTDPVIDDPAADPVGDPAADPSAPVEGESEESGEGTGETENENTVPPINTQFVGQNYAFSKLGFWIGETYIPLYEDANAANGVAPLSLLPLEEVKLPDVDLSGLLPSQLKAVKLETVWADKPADAQVVWSKDGDQFQALAADGTMDLSPINTYGSNWLDMTLIAGPNAADQTEPSNVRYTFSVQLPSLEIENLFSFKVTGSDGTEKPISRVSCGPTDNYGHYAYIRLNSDQVLEEQMTVQLIFNEANSLGATLTELSCNGEVLTDGKLTVNKYYDREVTVKLAKDGAEDTSTLIVDVSIDYVYGPSLSMTGFYDSSDVSSGSTAKRVATYYSSDELGYVYSMNFGYSPDDKYYCRMRVYNGSIANVTKAVVGEFDSLESAAAQPDIKDELFAGGYLANYSEGVDFTAFFDDGSVYNTAVKLVPYVKSSYTGFSIYDMYIDTENGRMPCDISAIDTTENDGMGDIYITVYMLYDKKPVPEGSTIYPVFSAPERASVHLMGENGESGELQKSGESPVTFKAGKAYQYSVAAENGDDAMNYFVTFVTPAVGAKLHVPGDNVQDMNYDKDAGMPVREIHLGDLDYETGRINSDTYYDILATNVGDAALEGLSVRLESAQNVQLDPYWTFTEDGTGKLAPFSYDELSQGKNYYIYDNLANQAKIRLLPLYDAYGEIIHGAISGTLVISSDNGGEVKIKLTGIAGTPSITTETLVPGVKYVPYDTLVQTNSVGESDAVTFEFRCYNTADENADSALPDGLEWHNNGELYGVPLVNGTYEVYVELYANNEDHTFLDHKVYPLEIAINQDDNVWNASDNGYSVLDYIGALSAPAGAPLDGTQHYILTRYGEEIFRSEGLYGNFVAFYLDGQKLTPGTDYTSASGSTVITIFEETLRRAGAGTHTIAAEFHELKSADGLPHGEMKRTAQNYTMDPNAVRNSVDLSVYLVDGQDKPLEGYTVTVHSTPKTGATNKDGVVTFRDVEFGEHTVTVSKDGSSLTRAFTLVSGDSTALNGSTVTAKPGSGIALTIRLDDDGLELVSARTGNPATGDETHPGLFAAMTIVSLLGLGAAGAALSRKRRKEEN